MTPLRIGTRGSALATTQTSHVAEALTERSGLAHELVVIRTEGDVTTGSLASLGGTGVFASALRAAVLDGVVDAAVHSLKDLPAAQPETLEIAAVPARADLRDALCARDGLTLATLPEGARVGTGSPRRVAQLKALRPDLELVDIRGNVQTRLARVPGLEQHDDHAPAAVGSPRGDLDAVILACAGLDRLGLDHVITERIDPEVMVPAPGQGALAVEIRAEDESFLGRALLDPEAPVGRLHAALELVDDRDTHVAVTAERALLRRLEAGCAAPIGAVARVSDGEAGAPRIEMTAMVAALDGSRVLRRTSSVQLDPVPADVVGDPAAADEWLEDTLFVAAEALGVHVAEQFVAEGADLLPGTVRGVDRGDGAPRPDDPA
ncbi:MULTISPECIES: hydroxymethylbilane synthase [Micrococcus]|uniref:hydroxymethylbilane synthase n=1 Tax=Micrococcus TaxID=1269 RepID=UPI0007655B9D|nr:MULTISPECIES: hydroxymethylbilane synthase [Micrococcus]CVM05123.1 porphobilinogen deaminase [Streptococcus pneumoniae]MBF0755778.1 hydroxymethylbilane synthase [Micrococcus aloeverae]MCV7469252.1 hydroxymethylbilane synthase [Micrococcus luteus]MCV7513484.1 hydroxymethylbilane synthase [Micrococcus luteus]MCV7526543.1 hydroxymethylbilane synthase [Micrococcus luteus]